MPKKITPTISTSMYEDKILFLIDVSKNFLIATTPIIICNDTQKPPKSISHEPLQSGGRAQNSAETQSADLCNCCFGNPHAIRFSVFKTCKVHTKHIVSRDEIKLLAVIHPGYR